MKPPSSALAYLVPAVFAVVLVMFDPGTTWWFPSCPLYAATGLLCPLCGSLRALHALLHGAPQLALTLNPLVTVGATVAAGTVVHDVVRPAHATTVERLTDLSFSARGVALAVAFGVLRNIDWAAAWTAR